MEGPIGFLLNSYLVEIRYPGSLLVLGCLLSVTFFGTGFGKFFRFLAGPPNATETPLPAGPPIASSELNINGAYLGWTLPQFEQHWKGQHGANAAPGDFSGLFQLGPRRLTTPNGWVGYGGNTGLPPLTDAHFRDLGRGPADMIRGGNLYLKSRQLNSRRTELLRALGRPAEVRREQYWELWLYPQRRLVVQAHLTQDGGDAFYFLLGSSNPKFLEGI